jgi:hypothetical protein
MPKVSTLSSWRVYPLSTILLRRNEGPLALLRFEYRAAVLGSCAANTIPLSTQIYCLHLPLLTFDSICVSGVERDVAVQLDEEGIMVVEPVLIIPTDQTGDEAAGGECSLYMCAFICPMHQGYTDQHTEHWC